MAISKHPVGGNANGRFGPDVLRGFRRRAMKTSGRGASRLHGNKTRGSALSPAHARVPYFFPPSPGSRKIRFEGAEGRRGCVRAPRAPVCARAERVSGHLITPGERKSKPPREIRIAAVAEGSPTCHLAGAQCRRAIVCRIFFPRPHNGGRQEGVKPSQSIAN